MFDVASVKPVNPPAGPHVVSLIINHGRLNIEAAELRQIVGQAYAIQRVRVLEGPGWADSDQFDIIAKAERTDATRDEIRSMLQTLRVSTATELSYSLLYNIYLTCSWSVYLSRFS
jgi:uncharacterized protein (TIGR03435 family)